MSGSGIQTHNYQIFQDLLLSVSYWDRFLDKFLKFHILVENRVCNESSVKGSMCHKKTSGNTLRQSQMF